MSKELTEQWKNRTLKDGDYYVRREYGTIIEHYCNDLEEWIEYEQDVKEVLAPVPTYDQFVDISKKVEELKQQLEYAERTLKNIRILMTCDPSDMKELDENFCANQLALETVNGYFEKYGVGK